MVDRFNIRGPLSVSDRKDLISYLKSFPEWNQFETRIHPDSPSPGALSASMSVGYLSWKVTYKEYLVTITAVLGEIYITCEK